jgi:hypothetical protein
MRIKNGDISRNIYFIAIDSSDYTTKLTGLTDFVVYYSIDGGVSTVMTTPTVIEVDSVNMPGVYKLAIDEVNMVIATNKDTAELLIHIENNESDSTMCPVDRIVEIIENSEADNKGVVDTIQAVTDNLPDNGSLDNLDVAVSSRSSHAPEDIWISNDSDVGRTLTQGTKDDEIDSIKSTVDTNLDTKISTRSTLTAQNVWEYATRTLTSFGTLIADIWAYVIRTLTVGTKDSEIDDIKEKTDNLPDDTESELDDIDSAISSVDSKVDALPTASAIADAVLEETLDDHVRDDGIDRLAEILRALILGNYGWDDVTKVFTLYGKDGVTVIKQFTVSSSGRS